MPDLATVTAGVDTRAETAAAALAANSETMTAIFAAIDAAGIERRDVQTSQLSLSPVFEPFREDAEAPPAVVAYEASNLVTVRVRAIDSLGAVIDALAKAGANRLQGVSFDVAEPRAAPRRGPRAGGRRRPRPRRALRPRRRRHARARWSRSARPSRCPARS